MFGDRARNVSADKRVGFVPQSPALLPWRTVLENVRLPLPVDDPVEVLFELKMDDTALPQFRRRREEQKLA